MSVFVVRSKLNIQHHLGKKIYFQSTGPEHNVSRVKEETGTKTPTNQTVQVKYWTVPNKFRCIVPNEFLVLGTVPPPTKFVV